MMQWRIRAELSADGDLELNRAEGDLLEGSPVDLLIAAVAGCFVKSCQMVQAARSEKTTRVVAEVLGTKAEGHPNRVASVSIAYDLSDLTPEKAAKIAKDAKRICTVTNSMSCEFEVVSLT